MEPTQPVSEGPTEGEPRRPWIRYRVEHRQHRTDELVYHRDTQGPDPDGDDNYDKLNGAAFMLVTTYRTGASLPPMSSQGFSSSAVPVVTSPPLYSIHLFSPAIVHALRSVVQYYPSQDLTGDIVIKWPYAILVHHYDELAQFRDNVSQKDARDLCEREKRAYEDLGLLLQYLDESIMPEVLQEKERNAKGYHTFEYMWVQLKPGTTILATYRENLEFHPQVIHSMSGGVFQSPPTDWITWSWNMRYNGEYLGRYWDSSACEKFDGERQRDTTIVGDLDSTNDLPQIVSNQLRYGEAYWRLLQRQCRHYKGKTREFLPKEVRSNIKDCYDIADETTG